MITLSRVINIWNSLPDRVVEADSINSFKSRLDKYWTKQDVIYNYDCDCDLTGGRENIRTFFLKVRFVKNLYQRVHHVIDRPAISCIQISLRASRAQPKPTTSYRGSASIYQSQSRFHMHTALFHHTAYDSH